MELLDGAEAGVIRLKEHESCQTQRLSKANIDVLSAHFGKYLAVNPTWEPGVCELKARQYVGTIVLDEIRIVIEPKVPLDNLFYMLTFTYDLPQFRQKEAPLSKSEDLFEFVVDCSLDVGGEIFGVVCEIPQCCTRCTSLVGQ